MVKEFEKHKKALTIVRVFFISIALWFGTNNTKRTPNRKFSWHKRGL